MKVVELESFDELVDEVGLLEEFDVNSLDENADENMERTHFPLLKKKQLFAPQTIVSVHQSLKRLH